MPTRRASCACCQSAPAPSPPPARFVDNPPIPQRIHPVLLRVWAGVFVSIVCFPALAAADEVDQYLRDLKAVSKQGAGSATARAAWDKLVARGPAVLPRLLLAMDTPDTVAANWLRTAFDRIVDV